jgi:hypothetical protein
MVLYEEDQVSQQDYFLEAYWDTQVWGLFAVRGGTLLLLGLLMLPTPY